MCSGIEMANLESALKGQRSSLSAFISRSSSRFKVRVIGNFQMLEMHKVYVVMQNDVYALFYRNMSV